MCLHDDLRTVHIPRQILTNWLHIFCYIPVSAELMSMKKLVQGVTEQLQLVKILVQECKELVQECRASSSSFSRSTK
jgi:hypothetical protein